MAVVISSAWTTVIDRQGYRTVRGAGRRNLGPNTSEFGLELRFRILPDQTRFDASAVTAPGSTRSVPNGAMTCKSGYRDRLTVGSSFNRSPLVAVSSSRHRLDLQRDPIVYYLDGRRIGDYRVKACQGASRLRVQNRYGECVSVPSRRT